MVAAFQGTGKELSHQVGRLAQELCLQKTQPCPRYRAEKGVICSIVVVSLSYLELVVGCKYRGSVMVTPDGRNGDLPSVWSESITTSAESQ